MKVIYLHPLPLRIWHWTNALMIMILLASGIRLRILGITALQPHDPFLLLHQYAGWALAASSLFWFSYGVTGGHLRRHFLMKKGDIAGIARQLKYYLVTIFRGEKDPFQPSEKEKYNPLQKIAYGAVMLIFVPVQTLSGLAFSHIGIMQKYVLLWDASGLLVAIHVIGAYLFILYLIVHVYMSTLGPTAFSHIRAMITGYEEAEESVENDWMADRG
jgi:thiosulfate reductase cytochrome b subunit